jgi:CheY-like chemotaxis protein
MKILLIDDEAENGWKEVIEKVLFNGESIEIAIDVDSAKEQLNHTKYQMIILDLRFGEPDHKVTNISKFGGYKILSQEVRSSFNNLNFSTPVLLFTASNKVWNIMEMIEAGADDYYIKEHPDTAYDLDFSRKNYFRLKGDSTYKGIINDLLEIGKKRTEVLERILEIIDNSKTAISNDNIKLRIEEKLKIGYGLLFRKTTKIETEKLLFNNEVVAFIVFWSILEEVSHDYYNRLNETELEWTLKKNNKKVQYFDSTGRLFTLFDTVKEEFDNAVAREDLEYAYQVNLSNQISGILRYQLGWNHNEIHEYFLKKLNKYRNAIDFIHSSTQTILCDNLQTNIGSSDGYKKCLQILDFLLTIIK